RLDRITLDQALQCELEIDRSRLVQPQEWKGDGNHRRRKQRRQERQDTGTNLAVHVQESNSAVPHRPRLAYAMRMRVWLASFPRSGNIFARLVLKEVYGIASDTVYPNEAGGKLARFLAETAGDQPSDRPWFTKTHEIAAADESSPGVYLVRDGRDAYVSYAHFARHTDPAGHAAMS